MPDTASAKRLPGDPDVDVDADVDVAIVGGGLSGLAVASALPSTCTWVLLEAHPTHLGGRLRSTAPEETHGRTIDLGAAWVWPSQQPRISALLAALGLRTFPQPDDASSARIVGGAHGIVAALAASLPSSSLRLDWPVTRVTRISGGVELCRECGARVVRARRAVLTAPPRLLVERVEFSPALPDARLAAMRQTRTWMAGVTKVVVSYPTRFWPLGMASSAGFVRSADAPAFQVYDSGGTGDDDEGGALTFFALASEDSGGDSALAHSCAEQLVDMWRRTQLASLEVAEKLQNADKRKVVVQRWPRERWISDEVWPQRVHGHPVPSRALGSPEWDGMLLFAGTEADQCDPGLMEGAVGAAQSAVRDLQL